MKMILLRHGNRDLTSSSDGGLNQVGKELAAGLHGRLTPQGDLPVPTQLIASPKKRAQETLLPLSNAIDLRLKIEKRLDERQTNETSTEFRLRVRTYLEQLPKEYRPTDVLYLCTHADWLEDAMITIPSDIPPMVAESGFACGEHRKFEFKDGIWVYLK